MVDPNWLKKIKQIEIRTVRLVEDALAGQYHSVFKGRGMDFEEVREYQIGDDVRRIDWNVTARTGTTFIKKFREERELTTIVMVDSSASGELGSVEQSKRELAAELASVLAFSAIRNQDKVGLILYTNEVEKFVAPRKGQGHVLRLIRDVLYAKPQGLGTNLQEALRYLDQVVKQRAVIFILSDFLDETFERALSVANQKHDIIALPISDPREMEMPNAGWIAVEDAETGEVMEINTSNPKLRREFSEAAKKRVEALQRTLRKTGVDMIRVQTGEAYTRALRQFFAKRRRRL